MPNKVYDIVKLYFTSPLHLSRGQTDDYDKSETILHSDTLKSALFFNAKRIFGDKINKDFLESFSVSSAFPFNEKHFYLPKPMTEFNADVEDVDEGPKKHKKIKKLKYLEKEYFEKVINKKSFAVKKSQFSVSNSFLGNDLNFRDFIKAELQQRVKKPLDGSSPVPYYLDRVFFEQGSGLFFMLEGEKQSLEVVKSAIKLLESEGVGTDRNVGNGQFISEYIEEGLSMELPEKANSITTLSLLLPQKAELNYELLDNSRYAVIKRGGYISSPEDINFLTFRKKSIYMFTEGSVFTTGKLEGNIADLKPENVEPGHPVYRDGRAFTIPILT